jgi:hypothetical protein
MMLILAASAAFGQSYQSPNSMVGVSVGTPSLVSLRGEAWVAREASFELGVGAPQDFDFEQLDLDVAIRWRPSIACINCGGRVLGTFGLGVGSVMGPEAGFDGPWAFAVGPDLVGSGVYWLSSQIGVQLSLRGGYGAAWTGTDFDQVGGAGWFFGTLGLAF